MFPGQDITDGQLPRGHDHATRPRCAQRSLFLRLRQRLTHPKMAERTSHPTVAGSNTTAWPLASRRAVGRPAGTLDPIVRGVLAVVTAPEEGWGSAPFHCWAAVGLLAAFVAVQARRSEPLVRLGIFRAPNLSAGNASMQ